MFESLQVEVSPLHSLGEGTEKDSYVQRLEREDETQLKREI